MRAIQVTEFGGPEVLQEVDVERPEPGDDEVSIDVAYAGVGLVDALFRSGRIPLETPFVPGIEVSGRVRAVGAGVDDLLEGQLVAALLNDFGRTQRAGGYAQTAVAHRSMVAPVADESQLPAAAGVSINGVTAWFALHDLARVQPTDTVVVLGASGGLGSVTARLAAIAGCARVVGVVGHDVDRAPSECTEVVLADDLDGWAGDDANRVDVVIDPVGGSARATLLANAAPFGRHVIVGNASGDDPQVSTDAIWNGSNAVLGLSLGAIAHLRPRGVQSALTAVLNLVERGVLSDPPPDIVSLGRVAAVHEALEARTAPAKTVLQVAGA